MGTNIKTVREIRESIPVPTIQEIQAGGEELIVEIEKILYEKWVSVEWLKGEIKKHQKAFDYGSYWVNVENLLQLLEG